MSTPPIVSGGEVKPYISQEERQKIKNDADQVIESMKPVIKIAVTGGAAALGSIVAASQIAPEFATIGAVLGGAEGKIIGDKSAECSTDVTKIVVEKSIDKSIDTSNRLWSK